VRIPDERPGRPAPPDLAERREMMARMLQAGTWNVKGQRSETLAGVRVLRHAPPAARRGRVLHMHGGGFRQGAPEMVAPFAAALAARCGVEVVCPAYRLAPEHPFPAGLDDAYAVALALRAEGDGQLILSGDSAGGGLAAGVAALCVAEGVKLAGLVLLSAWLDVTVTSASYRSNSATDPLFSETSAQEAAELYLQDFPAEHPLASPLFGNLAGYPPTLVSVGAGEVLADDSRTFYERLRAAGAPAELHEIPGMEHVAVTRDMSLPGAAETFAAVVAMIERILA
jgi:acetyl esterase/lipase